VRSGTRLSVYIEHAMRLTSKRIVFVIAPRDFRDEELFGPQDILERDGARTVVASTRTGQCLGMRGGRAVATQLIDTIRAADLDALLIVGGEGAQAHLWPHRRLQEIVREVDAEGGLIGAICLGPGVLARAGVLRGKRATIWPTATALAEIQGGGATYVEEPVTVMDRIITGSGPDAAGRWAEAVAAALDETRANRRFG
jgi:protease I